MSRINLEDPIIERPRFLGAMKMGVTSLVGTANATIDADMGPVIQMTPTASRDLTLPAIAGGSGRDDNMRGLTFFFVTSAAFTLVVKNSGGTTVATVPAVAGSTGMVVCLGDTTLGIGGWTGGVA